MSLKRGCCTIIFLIYSLIISIIGLILSIIPWPGAWIGYFILYSGLGIPKWPPSVFSIKLAPLISIIYMIYEIISLPACSFTCMLGL